jgi:hypothetical protein
VFGSSGKDAATVCPSGSQRLYNGICLTTQWPPTDLMVFESVNPRKGSLAEQLPLRSPVTPPYLASPPPVIDVSVGRQLFVDDFLISAMEGVERVEHKGHVS